VALIRPNELEVTFIVAGISRFSTLNKFEYRGRTHLLITADHGRGRTAQDWRDHNSKTDGSQDTWIALVSPRMDRRGEWGEGSALSTSQIAATLADWMGIDWNSDHPNAGHVIR